MEEGIYRGVAAAVTIMVTGAVLAWLFRWTKRVAPLSAQSYEMSMSRCWGVLALLGLAIFVPMALAPFLWPETFPHAAWLMVLIGGVAAVGNIYLVLEIIFTRVTVDDQGLIIKTWSHRARCFPWSDIKKVSFGKIKKAFEIETNAGVRGTVSTTLRGHENFVNTLKKELSDGITCEAINKYREIEEKMKTR